MEKRRGLVIVLLAAMIVMTGIAAAERTGNDPVPKSITELDPLVTADLTTGVTPDDLVTTLLGPGITVVPGSVAFTGADIAGGTFSGGTGVIGFESGIILSSGAVSSVVGPNLADGTTTANGLPGDADLDGLIPGFTTFDATVLEFDFVPTSDAVTFSYVFTSEEYNEFVGSSFNDVFGFFVNGVNVALIPGTAIAVSINNVNSGNPFDPTGTTGTNPAFYINNDLSDGGGAINTEMDGLTVVLTITAPVTPDESNHIKLAIADAGDSVLDSDVFIAAGSFIPGPPPQCSDGVDNDGDGLIDFPADPGCTSPADDDETDPVVDVPEFPSLVLPVIGVLGLVLLLYRRREN